MGLAASQARFLNLTARKTNIEYEGQQINQQRTTLANQSANYYNSMLTLSVPTPPSTENYKTIVYSVNYGQDYTLNQVSKNAQGSYTVLYTTSYQDSAMRSTVNGYAVSLKNGKYYYGGKEIKLINDDPQQKLIADSTVAGINENLKADKQVQASDVYFVNMGSESAANIVYFTAADLKSATDNNTVSKAYKEITVTKYNQGSFQNCTIERDASNRITSISSPDLGNGELLSVSSTSVTDDAAYEDAYNQYQYETYLYQQQLEEINAQTSIIQAQDKKLELRLKQLDTEQSAISTEMESVSSVIKKNTDDSFKTFA